MKRAIIVTAMLILLTHPTVAQHECQGGHNCNDAGAGAGIDIVNDLSGGDVDIVNQLAGDSGSFTSVALGQSLGDVDIAGCIVTTQWGIVIFQRQGFVYDLFCLARELEKAGKYAAAAEMRCMQEIPAKLYGDRCTTVMNFKPADLTETELEEMRRQNQRTSSIADKVEEIIDERGDRLDRLEQRLDDDDKARRAYARHVEAEKKVEEKRASDAFNAYKAAQQMELPPTQQEAPPDD